MGSKCFRIYLHCWKTAIYGKLAENIKLVCGMTTLYCFYTKNFIANVKERKTLVSCFTSTVVFFFKEIFMFPKVKK